MGVNVPHLAAKARIVLLFSALSEMPAICCCAVAGYAPSSGEVQLPRPV